MKGEPPTLSAMTRAPSRRVPAPHCIKMWHFSLCRDLAACEAEVASRAAAPPADQLDADPRCAACAGAGHEREDPPCAYSDGFLDAYLQSTTASELETAALELFVLSFFDEPEVLRLVSPRRRNGGATPEDHTHYSGLQLEGRLPRDVSFPVTPIIRTDLACAVL
jgi:hypothetical protein